MPPAIVPTAQMRSSPRPGRRKSGRNFAGGHFEQRRLHHHFAGELHAGGAQAHLLVSRPGERAQAAMKVMAVRFEEKAPNRSEQRVAEILVQCGHCARLNAALEPIAHYQPVTCPQLLQEDGDLSEVVAAVGVAHYDVLGTRGGDATHQRAPVPFSFDDHNTRAIAFGDLAGIVHASVVRNNDFPSDLVLLESLPDLFDAPADGGLFVEAGHYHGKLRRVQAGSFIRRSQHALHCKEGPVGFASTSSFFQPGRRSRRPIVAVISVTA